MFFVDTNILVRYLTGLPPDQAATAADIIDSGAELWVTVTSLAEVFFIMFRVAGVPRVEVVRALIDLMQKENIFPYAVDKDLLIRGAGNDAALGPGFHRGCPNMGTGSFRR